MNVYAKNSDVNGDRFIWQQRAGKTVAPNNYLLIT